jgi:ABC-2 type transport system ATP-binding protein
MLEIIDVYKRFGALEAVHGLSLRIDRGQTFGLLGPNGAGKTTLLRLITGILGPDRGRILLDGKTLGPSATTRIGYMPEERGLYRKMGVLEQLRYLGRLKGLRGPEARQRALHWLERLGLADWAKHRLEDLSKGMQQKVQFAATLLHDPDLVILDEPFSGLDPVNMQQLIGDIQALQGSGKTVLLSTHRMDQVQAFCPDIAVLHRGRLVLQGQVEAIRREHHQGRFRVRLRGDTGSLTHPGFEVLEQEREGLLVQVHEGHSGNEVLALLLERQVQVLAFEEILPSLNDVFIQHLADLDQIPASHG